MYRVGRGLDCKARQADDSDNDLSNLVNTFRTIPRLYFTSLYLLLAHAIMYAVTSK